MKAPHVVAAERYARAVVAGKIDACKWVRLACERHLADRAREKQKAFAYRFDKLAAEKVCCFLELLSHVKGRWASEGQTLKLEPWQAFFVCSVYGWVRKSDGLRRFRTAFLMVPRKNGKSFLAAGLGLYALTGDGEHGAEVFSGAVTQDQAWETFRPAREMALKSDHFREHYGVEVNASNINVPRTSSRFEPLIGRPHEGASPSFGIADELHEHPTSHLFDVLMTGMGARLQPLLLVTTTAGNDLAGPCYALQVEAQKMLEGTLQDDRLFALIYTVDSGDDWADPKVLRKCNPNAGISVLSEYLEAQQRAAIDSARKQSSFRTRHLNEWQGARAQYFDVHAWQQATQTDLRLDDFEGERCFLGMDLASKIDLASVAILFPRDDGSYVVFGRHYLPEATVASGAAEHYQGWSREGHLIVTPGNMIDFHVIRDDILELADRFNIIELAFDPHESTMLIHELMEAGISCIETRPTRPNLSTPMKILDGLIREGRIAHNGDPVQAWCLSNVVTREDLGGRVFPAKETREQKIDATVALITALARALLPAETATAPLFFAIDSPGPIRPLW